MSTTDADDGGDSAESPPDSSTPGPASGPGSFTERLTLIENGLEALASRLDDTEDAIATTLETIGGEIADLKANVDQLVAQERELVKPRRWAARATPKEWNELIDWVDELNNDYSLLSDYTIPPCWPAHAGVVEELAGLWRSWIHAVINDARAKKQGSSELTAWHDRWLWPGLERIKATHYRTTNCRPRHQIEVRRAAKTDAAFVSSVLGRALPPHSVGRSGEPQSSFPDQLHAAANVDIVGLEVVRTEPPA